MSNRAWVTLATNDSYGLGALVLAYSLRRANSAYPAVVLITPTVTEAMRNRLSAVYAEVITVDVLDSHDAAHLALLQRPELGITFTKIHCWTLTQYEKCVFLDADTLIIQNCDELFEREELSAAPDVGWPDCFNSGVFVYVPSNETFSRLITFAKERGSFDGGDQGLLNSFFSDWARGDINKHLPFLYNVTSAAFYSYIPALKEYGQDLKIIHFIGAAKPWLQNFNWDTRTVESPEHLRQFLQLWWDLFVGQVHCQLDTAMESAVGEEDVPFEPPPENPPEDVFQEYHYEPTIDPESEFSWHHPEAELEEPHVLMQQLDMTDIHDPWEHYRGNIPPFSQSSNYGGNDYESYQGPYNTSTWEPVSNRDRHEHQHKHDYHSKHHHYDHHYDQRQGQSHQHNKYINPHHDHVYHSQSHDQQQSEIHHESHWGDHSNYCVQTHNSDSYQSNPWNKNDQHSQFEPIRDHSFQSHSSQYQHDHHYEEPRSQQPQYHGYQPEHHQEQYKLHNLVKHHESPHDYHPEHHQEHNELHGLVKHHETHIITNDHSHKQSEHRSVHHNGYNKHFNPFTTMPVVGQVYHLHLDHKRSNRRHRRVDRQHICANSYTNGHDSESESEDEFIIPRHPYDGFYLRHRPTIDPRGHKICTHEIPPTPSPSPSLEDDPPSSAASPLPEEFDTASECEDQYTGVAGNLARVVPGSSGFQREAIDELTRRQGWEAGNIDYMGADAFDNIWAKISQTLSQQTPKEPSPPRKEPTPPPKQPSPPKEQPEVTPSPAVPVPHAPAVTPPPTPEASPTAAPVLAPAPEVPIAAIETPKLAASAQVAPAQPISSAAEVPIPALDSLTAAPVPPAQAAPAEPTAEIPKATETAAISSAPAVEESKHTPKKTELTEPATPPATPKSTPEASSPVSKSPAPVLTLKSPPADAPKTVEPVAVASPVPAAEAPAAPQPAQPEATPEKSQDSSFLTASSTDSPPLANTPSKEEAPVVPAAKSEERRKPVGKLQLSPPAASDPLPTPDSELEDAAALAHAIIASELSASVTAPSPAATATSASPPALQDQKRLLVDAPEVPTPPVSLAQIGVKPKVKPTTAAQIESSISDKPEPEKPVESPKPAEAAKSSKDVKSAETKPAEPAKHAEAAKTSKDAKSAETKPVEPAKHVETPKAEEPTKSAEPTKQSAPATPTTPTTPTTPSEPGTPGETKKKLVKKGTKKEAGASASGDAPTPVPPPRKKEKKPKEK